MDEDYPKYELLAKYLDPQFGNIYEYNVPPDSFASIDGQEWTAELRDAVRHYLIHEMPAAVREQLVDSKTADHTHPETGDRWVNALLELAPWEVALEVRNAAIAAVPTLHELIGHLDAWPSADEELDTVTWLEAHSGIPDWRNMSAASNHPGPLGIRLNSGRISDIHPTDLVRDLTPSELLGAWDFAVGPAPTDLTDDEWSLLVPLFGQRRGPYGMRDRPLVELTSKRRTFDAVRFKLAHQVPWSHLPSRYGPWQSIYQMYRHYQANGLFVHLRDALQENSHAKDLVSSLDQMIAEPTPRKWHGLGEVPS